MHTFIYMNIRICIHHKRAYLIFFIYCTKYRDDELVSPQIPQVHKKISIYFGFFFIFFFIQAAPNCSCCCWYPSICVSCRLFGSTHELLQLSCAGQESGGRSSWAGVGVLVALCKLNKFVAKIISDLLCCSGCCCCLYLLLIIYLHLSTTIY